ncbi:tautomerase family protein [Saccharopolyspora taberi]|uniref:Tautomerase family protein n=1 Tax=Saccharopolyspora taberi TaxID=60895 RepID=A0ABN3VE13_9PSEU
MPFVRIDVLSERNADRLPALGDAVHEALVETIGIPGDDLFQLLNAHESGRLRYDPQYLGVRRDDDIVFVSITMGRGRTDDQKTALYKRITELVQERTGVEPRNVLINVTENGFADWSFGEGEAQRLLAGRA